MSTNCRNGAQRIRFNNTGADCHAGREPLAEILIDLAFPILRLLFSSFLMALFPRESASLSKIVAIFVWKIAWD